MIGYTTLGTNDLEKAVAFYDALFADLDVKQMVPNERVVLWSKKPGGAMLAVAKPFDGEAASVGNGTMVALSVDSAETVATLHAKALELGASDEGAPGERGGNGMHFGYFRDLDGNKLAFFSPPA